MTLMTGAKCQGGAFAADVADPNFVEIEARLAATEAAITAAAPVFASILARLDALEGGFSVSDYGVVGDGVHDDTAGINAAITAAAAAGVGVVTFPPGTFLFSSDIIGRSYIVLRGTSRYKTILKATANAKILFNDCSHWGIEKLSVNFNHQLGWISAVTVAADVTYGAIRQVDVYDSGTVGKQAMNILIGSYTAQNVRYIVVDDVYCSYAYDVTSSLGDNLYVGLHSTGVVEYVRITNSIFTTAGRQNISIASAGMPNAPDYVLIDNCWLIDSALAGIDYEFTERVIVSNCHFVRSGAYNGFFNGSSWKELNPGTGMQSAISIHGYYHSAVIVNCIFDSCFYGITGYPTHLNVTNCRFYDSLIGNGGAAMGLASTFVNCYFETSGAITHLYQGYDSVCSFVGCDFVGDPSTHQQVFLEWDSIRSRNTFDNCRFHGVAAATVAIYMSGVIIELHNCCIDTYKTVIESRGVGDTHDVVIFDHCLVRDVGTLLKAGLADFIAFRDNTCYNVNDTAGNTSALLCNVRDLVVDNNRVYLAVANANYAFIDEYNAQAKTIHAVGNHVERTGVATDSRFLYGRAYTTWAGVCFGHTIERNYVKGFSKFVDYGISGADVATQSRIVNNVLDTVTTAFPVVTGFDLTTTTISGNTEGGVPHGWSTVTIVETLTPVAVETSMAHAVPRGAIIRSVQGNAQVALTGGGTTVTWGFGITGDVDKYGTAGFPVQADSLAQNSKSTMVLVPVQLAAAETIKLIGAAAGGAAAGNTALTVGSVKVVVVYDVAAPLANA